jgi:hypothetical protein
MDRVPLWRGNHVPIRQLVEDFGRYLYLPRLQSTNVLVNAIPLSACALDVAAGRLRLACWNAYRRHTKETSKRLYVYSANS